MNCDRHSHRIEEEKEVLGGWCEPIYGMDLRFIIRKSLLHSGKMAESEKWMAAENLGMLDSRGQGSQLQKIFQYANLAQNQGGGAHL